MTIIIIIVMSLSTNKPIRIEEKFSGNSGKLVMFMERFKVTDSLTHMYHGLFMLTFRRPCNILWSECWLKQNGTVMDICFLGKLVTLLC